MSAMASQSTRLTIVYSTVYSDADQRKHQSSASLAFVRGIHRGPVNSPHKGPVLRKMFPFDDVIMFRHIHLVAYLGSIGVRISCSYTSFSHQIGSAFNGWFHTECGCVDTSTIGKGRWPNLCLLVSVLWTLSSNDIRIWLIYLFFGNTSSNSNCGVL